MRNTLYYNNAMNAPVNWSKRDEHMFERHGITTGQAEEALADPERLWIEPDYASRNGISIRVVGYCSSIDTLLTLILVPHEGTMYGASGWRSNSKDQRLYREKGEGE